MPYADDILMPHPPEVVAAMLQKKLAEVEKVFPGLVDKVRAYPKSDDFKRAFKVSDGRYASFKIRSAPSVMKFAVARLAGLNMDWYQHDNADEIEWVCDYVWVCEGLSKIQYDQKHYGRHVFINRKPAR